MTYIQALPLERYNEMHVIRFFQPAWYLLRLFFANCESELNPKYMAVLDKHNISVGPDGKNAAFRYQECYRNAETALQSGSHIGEAYRQLREALEAYRRFVPATVDNWPGSGIAPLSSRKA